MEMYSENVANHSNSSTAGNKTTNHPYNRLFAVPVFLSIYGLILMCAIIGNCLVCWIVKADQRMHDVTNYLLINLAVSDLLLALSSVFQVVDFVVKNLNLGDIGCKFQINMYNIPYGSSVLTLAVIAYERYYAVCKPMRCEDMKQRIKWIIPSTWLISIAIYSPMIYYCGSRANENNQLSCDCVYRWPTVRTHDIYGIFIFVVTYAVPLIAIIAFYSLIIRRLRQGPPGESQGNISMYRARQRVVKMLLITIVLFFVSWTPYNILYLLKKFQVDFRRIYKQVWYPSLLLGFLNCAYNPLIYCLFSKNFREGFKKTLCFCRHCRFPLIVRQAFSSRTPSSRSTRRTNLDEIS